jgi:hypothetical protein
MRYELSVAAVVILTAGVPAAAQHLHGTDRAQRGMGFDQQKTIHHFLLQTDGGTIEVTAKDPADAASIDQIRMHLRHVETAFAAGDFSLPAFIHETEPPGSRVLKDRRSAIDYSFVSLPGGAKLVIRTSDATALAALHDFLRYQIREHRTGDPMAPPGKPK